ncbi:hypothetical protein CHARACLAT_027979 [Characodon lateralis]|uniref:Uncharacterized protein n=1 Tax=Characodon lateralis TaxID=208331 RepID=A0ABU7CVX8_9TELE|nr:hypothetical protein [Characodon lateralis]
MCVEVSLQNNAVPERGTVQHPPQKCHEGQVLCITGWPVGLNNSQRPRRNMKGQGCNPLIHQGKPQHEVTELGGGTQTHPSVPPLPKVEESPTSLKEVGSMLCVKVSLTICS